MSENFSIDLNKKIFLSSEDKKIPTPAPITPIISEIKKSADEEKYFIQLRDCFNAGYQFPQYCIDNNIKKPLFVGVDNSQESFIREIHFQFNIDKRLPVTFCMRNGTLIIAEFVNYGITPRLNINNIEKINFNIFDKIIVLSNEKLNFSDDRIIYLDSLTTQFIRRTFAEIPILHYLSKHPQVKVIYTNIPQINRRTPLSDCEKKLLKSPSSIWQLVGMLNKDTSGTVKTPFDFLGYSNEYVKDLVSLSTKVLRNEDGSTRLEDNNKTCVNIKNGSRQVPNQPKNFKNTIYFMGTCTYFGIGAPTDRTVEGWLQKMLNEHNLPYRVENASQFFHFRYQDIFYNLSRLSVKPNDIIFICLLNLKSDKMPFFDTLNLFDRPHNYGEVFVDTNSHLNEIGYKILAEKFFEYLTENDFFQHTNFEYPPPRYTTSLWYSKREYHRRNKIFAKSAA